MITKSVNTILDVDAGPAFCPPKWLRNGHLQTVYAAYLFNGLKPYSATEHRVELEDGDSLILHDDCPGNWQPGERIVLLVHGLTGCHASSHVARVSQKMNSFGIRTIRMDQRGSGAGAFTAKRHTYAGASHDLQAVVDFIVKAIKGSPLIIVGFSMGGNILLKYLSEDPDALPPELDSAISVSPPIDLQHCAWKLTQGLNRVYDYRFLRRVYRSLRQRRQQVSELIDYRLDPAPDRLIQFDDQFVAPAAGYRSAREYYQKSSAAPMLHQTRVPTLLIAAKDDPLIPFEIYTKYEMSDAIRLFVTESGGHLGYINQQSNDPDRRWLDWRLCEWIAALPNRLNTNGCNGSLRHAVADIQRSTNGRTNSELNGNGFATGKQPVK